MRKLVAERAGEGVLELLRGLEEEVLIEADGAPRAVLVPLELWAEAERVKLEWLKAAIAEGEADLAAGRVVEIGDVDALVQEVMEEVREPRRPGRDAA